MQLISVFHPSTLCATADQLLSFILVYSCSSHEPNTHPKRREILKNGIINSICSECKLKTFFSQHTKTRRKLNGGEGALAVYEHADRNVSKPDRNTLPRVRIEFKQFSNLKFSHFVRVRVRRGDRLMCFSFKVFKLSQSSAMFQSPCSIKLFNIIFN